MIEANEVLSLASACMTGAQEITDAAEGGPYDAQIVDLLQEASLRLSDAAYYIGLTKLEAK